MIANLKRTWSELWGSGEASVTMPIMDGAMRPNNALDKAETIALLDGVDNLVSHADTLYFTQGSRLMSLSSAGLSPHLEAEFGAQVGAVAISESGEIFVALDDGGLVTRPVATTAAWKAVDVGTAPAFVTAMAFNEAGDLHLCVGSVVHRASEWKYDLMNVGSTGSLWVIKAGEGRGRKLLDGLAFPSGVSCLPDGQLIVSEAWRHRLVRIGDGGRPIPSLTDLPGYPGRIAVAGNGALWVCVFAPRSQMIEFVLREKAFRQQMIETIDDRYWMAPTLRAGKDFKEPVQGGGIRHLGIQKPWGPTRSYGLVIEVSDGNRIIRSLHSRSDGNRHGMTSIASWKGRIVASSKGDGALIALPTAEENQ